MRFRSFFIVDNIGGEGWFSIYAICIFAQKFKWKMQYDPVLCVRPPVSVCLHVLFNYRTDPDQI